MRAPWLPLIAVLGCNGSGDASVDAPGSGDDAATDAGTDAPWQVGTVSVTVTDNGAPVSDVVAYFQNPDSSLAARVLTGANGTASATVAAGGWVTIVDPSPLDRAPIDHLFATWAGIKPDDQLRYDFTSAAGPGLGVSFTAPVDPTATSYRLHASCVIPFSDFMLPPDATHPKPYLIDSQWPECVGDGTDLLVESLDANDEPLRYLFVPNVDLTDGGTFDITGTWTAPVTTTRTFTSVPQTLLSSGTEMWTMHGTAVGYGDEQIVSNGSVVLSNARPAIPGAIHYTSTRLLRNYLTHHSLLDWEAGNSSTFDLAGVLLPEAASTPVFDVTTHRVTWTAGAGPTPDAIQGYITASRPGKRIDWYVMAPYQGTATPFITLPDLPQHLDSIEPIATDEVRPYLTAIKLPGGYDALRTRSLAGDFEDPRHYATTPTGRVTIATYSPFEP